MRTTDFNRKMIHPRALFRKKRGSRAVEGMLHIRQIYPWDPMFCGARKVICGLVSFGSRRVPRWWEPSKRWLCVQRKKSPTLSRAGSRYSTCLHLVLVSPRYTGNIFCVVVQLKVGIASQPASQSANRSGVSQPASRSIRRSPRREQSLRTWCTHHPVL